VVITNKYWQNCQRRRLYCKFFFFCSINLGSFLCSLTILFLLTLFFSSGSGQILQDRSIFVKEETERVQETIERLRTHLNQDQREQAEIEIQQLNEHN